jgi:hypothetical protein
MPALDAEDGRGLLLVASMSSRWGYYHPRRGGKVVWCELLVKSALDDTSGLPHTLPKRKHGGRKSTEVMSDPQILQWVLDRLRQLGQ